MVFHPWTIVILTGKMFADMIKKTSCEIWDEGSQYIKYEDKICDETANKDEMECWMSPKWEWKKKSVNQRTLHRCNDSSCLCR